MTKREELLKLLKDYVDPPAEMLVGGRVHHSLYEEAAHRAAEKLLLTIVGDAEITAAWEDAADKWWYA